MNRTEWDEFPFCIPSILWINLAPKAETNGDGLENGKKNQQAVDLIKCGRE
jgi:hypothetical protein